MALILSIVYLAVSYLTPEALFGFLARFHIQLIIAVLTFLASIPRIVQSRIFKLPQTLALLALPFVAFLSIIVAKHWVGGGISVFVEFFASILPFFLVYLNFNTKKRLQGLVAVLFLICLLIVLRGISDLSVVSGSYGPPINPQTGSADLVQWNAQHPYLFPMTNSEGAWFYRIRGLGIISDPNDFAQLLICVIPLMFIFWRPKKLPRNILFVVIPVTILLIGTFLTHSRGALLALAIMTLVTVRRRIGTIPAVVLTGGLLLGAMALQFSGGRSISPNAGEDRVALWGEAIAVFRTHPFFGVGYSNLADFTDEHLTAHNSVIVCAAELGIFGYYLWSIFLFTSSRDAYKTVSPKNVTEGETIVRDPAPFPHAVKTIESIDKEDINRLGHAVFLSMVGYLVAGWFLSRAIVITLFLLGGFSEAVYQMALDRQMVPPRLALRKVLPYSAMLAIGLLIALYVLVRVLNSIG